MDEELEKIEKRYGEGMPQLCRKHFPALIGKGVLFDILQDNFETNKYLSEDIREYCLEEYFQDYVNARVQDKQMVDKFTDKTPFELMSMAGYDLYECKTEEDIQKFKHYYAKGEELCTFEGGRLKSSHVFFAVKKNVDEIKREDFSNPKRQDEYGTSVLSIQFVRGEENYISIINRYNHSVKNSSKTFSNDLNNIQAGLKDSFNREYGLNIVNNSSFLHIPGYVKAKDEKYYRFNCEIDRAFYCSNNTIIDDGKVIKYDKDKYLLVDYFLIDLENKTVSLYDHNIKEDFVNHLKDIDDIEIKDFKTDEIREDEKEIIIKKKDGSIITIKTNKHNQMIGLDSDDITEIGDDFLSENEFLSEMSLNSVKKIGKGCLKNNKELSDLGLSSAEIIGSNFAYRNLKLRKVDLPMARIIKGRFLYSNQILDELSAPNLEIIEEDFLYCNRNITSVILQSAKIIGNNFIKLNEKINELIAPSLEKIGAFFLLYNRKLSEFVLPSLKSLDYKCLYYNNSLEKIYLPELEDVEEGVFGKDRLLGKLYEEAKLNKKTDKDKKLEERAFIKDEEGNNEIII